MVKHCQQYSEIYKKFFKSFKLVTKAYLGQPFNLEFDEKREGRLLYKLTLKRAIYLKEWPVEISNPIDKIDISIFMSMDCIPSNSSLSRSTVCVTYLKSVRDVDGISAKAFENIRFDYHPDIDDIAHPLLHAHVFSSKKPDLEPEELNKSASIDWSQIENRIDVLRIPVPNMTLPSVLCCLVGKHLGKENLQNLFDQTRKEWEIHPKLNIPESQFDLFRKNSFAGFQWFERP